MDPITQQATIAAAGAGGGDPVYVDDVFSTYLYTGNDTNDRNIVNNIDLAGEGGLVWIKNRGTTENHIWVDTERGADEYLKSNTSDSQGGAGSRFNAFNSNGFQVSGSSETNGSASGGKICSWTFRKAPGFFDVVTWSGNSVNGRELSHSLGSVPGMIICKCINTAGTYWTVWHNSVNGGNARAYCFLTTSFSTLDAYNFWGNGSSYIAPTASKFTVAANANLNVTNSNYVAYIFAHDDAQFGTDEDESIIKCGTYTGNSGSQSIDLGFEPQWLMVKCSTSGDSGNHWMIFDSMRKFINATNADSKILKANDNDQEISGGRIHPTATGFGFHSESSLALNQSGQTYIYMAIRRPNKPPEVATEAFFVTTTSNDDYTNLLTSGFPVDLVFQKNAGGGGFGTYNYSRLAGSSQYLNFAATAAEGGGRSTVMDSNTQFSGFGGLGGGSGLQSFYAFKRAPGFFDVVAYSGAGGVVTHSHNLGVVPELMIFKSRNSVENWFTYHKDFASPAHHVLLNLAGSISTNSGTLNNTAPTASIFTVGNDNYSNGSGGQTYIAYLFASLPGISKVGSYTGSNSAQNIDCGFTNGARFVLIKRTDGTADWFVYDTARGISSGNDPYLKINQSEAEVTNTDYIDPLNAGFIVNGNVGDINTSGGSYIFLAIA